MLMLESAALGATLFAGLASAGPVCDASYQGPNAGAWTTAANWSNGEVPGSAGFTTEQVCIGSGVTVELNSSEQIGGLVVGDPAGTAATSTLNVQNALTLRVDGSASVTDTGAITGLAGTLDITSGALTNDGSIEQAQNLTLDGSFTNAADGRYDVQGGGLRLAGPGTVTNDGELVVEAAANATLNPNTTVTFDNAAGTLVVEGGSSATLQVDAGATFDQGAGQVIGTASNARPPVRISGGALELTGSGSGSFFQDGGTLDGTIAATQSVLLGGTNATTGPLTNDGSLVTNGGTTLTVASGGTLTNDGLLSMPAGGTLNLTGTIDNASSGTIAVGANGGATLSLQPPYALTNDGSISNGPSSTVNAFFTSGMAASVDNDGGTIANGQAGSGGWNVASGVTFTEGGGTTTGNPVDVAGVLDITGSAAANLELSSGTLSGNVASGQLVTLAGTNAASGSFANAGTLLAAGHLNLPAGDTLTNSGTLGLTGNLTLSGSLANTAQGTVNLGASQLVATANPSSLQNQGELYQLGSASVVLGQGVSFTSSGDIRLGEDGGAWGGFGIGQTIEGSGSAPFTVHLDGSLEPVFPQGNPPSVVTLPPQWVSGSTSIGYAVAQLPGTTMSPFDDVTCDAATPADISLGCTDNGGLDAVELFDNAPGLVPTNVAISSSAPSSTVICGVSCPTSAYGNAVTLTATVTPEYGTTAPTGTVTFFDGPVAIGTGAVSTSAGVSSATLTSSSFFPTLNQNDHQFWALYNGDANDLEGLSSRMTEAVTAQTTSTGVGVASSPSTLGQLVALTATVTPTVAGPASPTGEVVFYAGASPLSTGPGTLLGAAPVSTSGGVSTAVLDTTALPPGSDQVVAQYSGDGDYSTSTSTPAAASITAPAAPTHVSVAGPSVQDAGTTYTATASADGGLPQTYALAVAPAPAGGLSVDPVSGAISYAVPVIGVTSFTYVVVAVNAAGRVESSPVTVTVPQSQTIAFVAPSSGAVGSSSALTPSASSGLAVLLAIDSATTNGACTLSGDTVDYAHTGSCVIDANQAGDGVTYAPAATVTQTIAVGPGSQTVAFTSMAPLSATVGGATYTPLASATSHLPAAIALDSSSSGCSMSAGVVSFTGAGTCVIDANQAGNADWNAAARVQQRIPVSAGAVSAAAVAAQTLADVQGSSAYRALNARTQSALSATVNALSSVLSVVSPTQRPAINAAALAIYDAEVAALRAGGFLTAAQASSLDGEAASLA